MFNRTPGTPIPEISSEVSSNPMRDKNSLFYFLDKNSQYKNIYLIKNTQQHPIP